MIKISEMFANDVFGINQSVTYELPIYSQLIERKQKGAYKINCKLNDDYIS